jgi:selenocysteine lyase/cysteine desulfurase
MHETKLAEKLLNGLQEVEGVEIYGPKDMKGRSGVVLTLWDCCPTRWP